MALLSADAESGKKAVSKEFNGELGFKPLPLPSS
jgi:hypothetical protein